MLQWEYGEPVDDENIFREAFLFWLQIVKRSEARKHARKQARIRRALARRPRIRRPRTLAQITSIDGTKP